MYVRKSHQDEMLIVRFDFDQVGANNWGLARALGFDPGLGWLPKKIANIVYKDPTVWAAWNEERGLWRNSSEFLKEGIFLTSCIVKV